MQILAIYHADGTTSAYKAEQVVFGVSIVRGHNNGSTVWAYAPQPGDFMTIEDEENSNV